MQFSGPFADGLASDVQAFIDIMGVSTFLSGSAIEATKLAINVTNIGGIEMPIDVEVSSATVALSPYCVSELTQGRQVVCCI